MKKSELQQIIREEIQNTLKLNEAEDKKILSSDEAEDFLNNMVQDYIEGTIDIAGDELDFGDGVIGFDNEEQLIKDFIDYLQGSLNLPS